VVRLLSRIGAAGLLAANSALAGAADPVEIHHAWVRAMPPGQTMTAAYLEIHNSGPSPQVVTAATAEIAGSVEIHSTTEIDGMLRMRELPRIELAPGERIKLAPGGTHLMMLDLRRTPQEGETVSLCLHLGATVEVCTDAPVAKSLVIDEHSHH
jgi:copper(I)-binding protein